ncbi:GNAT family N-acetyltransferase [Pseudomonas entomophila]|uniref:GNAT family N-acetyltransferase n=1 Tax=Pseudomonas entomophila TaxID=312306 RepID=UPI003EC09117
MQLIDYHQLSQAQREQLNDLRVHPGQVRFAGDIANALYILLSVDSDDRRGLVLLVEDVPKAFMLIERGAHLPTWAEPDAVTLNALQVDWRCQGQGLGRFCMGALPPLVRGLWPQARALQLSVDPDNQAAIGLYQASGWSRSGDGYRARVHREWAMTLPL